TSIARGPMLLSVLIIEDDLDFAEFVINGLAEEGFSVRHATNGLGGRAMLENKTWDLVLLDWSLPGQDGLALLRAFRDSGGECPGIFLPAKDPGDERARGPVSGAAGYA